MVNGREPKDAITKGKTRNPSEKMEIQGHPDEVHIKRRNEERFRRRTTMGDIQKWRI